MRPPSTATASTFADNVNVLADPTAPATVPLEQIGPAEAQGIAQFATVTSRDVVDLGARKAYRITYKASAFSGVAYIIQGTTDTWVLTYSFGADAPDVDLAQSSATTFNPP